MIDSYNIHFRQSSSQSYDKDDSVGNIKQSRMEVDKPAYDSGRAGSRFSGKARIFLIIDLQTLIL